MSKREQLQYGNTIIEYTVIHSPRRKKTIEITLNHGEGVLVAAPVDACAEQIRQVVLKRAGWIVRQAAEEVLRPRRKQFVSRESLPYLGRQARLFVEHWSARRTTVKFDHWSFHIVVPYKATCSERDRAVSDHLVVSDSNDAEARDPLRAAVPRDDQWRPASSPLDE